jgi:two-component system, OmpR family, phosphate regulon response regulator PhoB
MGQMTILVIEDERDILDLVAYNLTQTGFRVLRAEDGVDGLRMAEREKPDLIVLDLMLPRMDGKEVCRRIRQVEATRTIPVIMLTARVEEVDRIIGFEIGADDYITKPFSVRELVLRVQSILRRARGKEAPATVLRFAGLTIDPERHRVEVENEEVPLTALEFRLLFHLAANAGKVQPRDTLLDRVWGYAYEGYARTVDTHVRRLRQKLGPARDRIETIRGTGYRFREES